MSTMKPNIFTYATKELSQDAFFAWYFRWADPSMIGDSELQHSAQELLYTYISDYTTNIISVDIKRQYNHIDLLVIVNQDIYIIIEDKIYSGIHNNQLERYWNSISSNKKIGLFIKTGVDSDSEISKVGKCNYHYISRLKLLEHFKRCNSSNDIFVSYRDYWQEIENKRRSFKNNYRWEVGHVLGFYQELSKHLKNSNMHYAANPRGGDFVLNWHKITIEQMYKTNMFLEFSFPKRCCECRNDNEFADYFKLKIKIHLQCEDKDETRPSKTDLMQMRKKIKKFHLPEFSKFSKSLTFPPQRTRVGAYMTIADVPFSHLIERDFVHWNIECLVDKLQIYEKLLNNYKNHMNS